MSALRLLAAGLEGAGGDGVTLVRRAGSAGQATTDDARVPTDHLSRLWRRGLGATDDPCLGVKAAGHWRFGRLRLMDYLVANAPTLADVFTVTEEYSALVNMPPAPSAADAPPGTPPPCGA